MKIRLKVAAFVLMLSVMVGAAAALGEREIVFPEIAALLVGLLLAPRLTWRTTMLRMVLSLSLCAALGTGVSIGLPAPLAVKLVLAYALALGVLTFSGTTVAPMISAAVLPVLLGCDGWVYFVSATVLAAVCALLRIAAERGGLAMREPVRPHSGVWGGWRSYGSRLLAVAAVSAVAVTAGFPLLAAPPLMVAFTQFTRRRNPLAKRPWATIAAVAVCATLGAIANLALTPLLIRALATSLPAALASAFGVAVSAAAVSAAVAVFFIRTRFYFPPAAAMSILPFLLTPAQLVSYPFVSTLGIALFVLLARVLFGGRRTELRSGKRER